jgi:hypothetical protein
MRVCKLDPAHTNRKPVRAQTHVPFMIPLRGERIIFSIIPEAAGFQFSFIGRIY